MATVPSEPNTTIPGEPSTAAPSAPSTSSPGNLFRLDQFNQLPNQKKMGLMFVVAAAIALIVGGFIWTKAPDYRVLYTSVSDQDGSAIVSALQQMNVPYKLTENNGTILVPSEHVHEARLKLAGQGLPKGGLAGFELMENQKFGSSQFLEQVNYQRALEGELARSVQSLSAVQSARVHLAIAKPSVFSRDKQQPSVSVLLNLLPGRVLSIDQVSAIVHLVSSSVPNLPAKNVAIVDQHGNLLTSQNDNKSDSRFDAKQLEYIQEVEENYIRRIETILTPITGVANVRAQVTADVDFSRIERAEEIYRPNNTETEGASIRSKQTLETLSTGSKLDGGIPGALTNRPPEPAIAPVEVAQKKEGESDKTPPTPTDTRKESTTNYEIDKTIQHTHQSTGSVKRLSAAVVVNYRKKIGEDGVITYEPMTADEIKEISDLVKEAMGFNEKRGDSLAVINNQFTAVEDKMFDIPFWKDPDTMMLATEISKQLLIVAVILFFLLKILRPYLKNLTQPETPIPALTDGIHGTGTPALNQALEEEYKLTQNTGFEKNLKKAKQMAVEEPAIVANVVKEWVNGNG